MCQARPLASQLAFVSCLFILNPLAMAGLLFLSWAEKFLLALLYIWVCLPKFSYSKQHLWAFDHLTWQELKTCSSALWLGISGFSCFSPETCHDHLPHPAAKLS